MKYRIMVPVMVDVCIDIEADDEFGAECKCEELDLDFSLQSNIHNGVGPIDGRMFCISGEPDYDRKSILENDDGE
jgi:hypothetical protein